MVYPTSQFLFLVEKKATWVRGGGCFVHLQDNPRGWESGVLGARGHAPSFWDSSLWDGVAPALESCLFRKQTQREVYLSPGWLGL